MSPELVRHHIKYSGWASRKLLDATRNLPEEKQKREVGVSHKTLIGTLEHVYLGDRAWFSRAVDASVLDAKGPLAIEWPKLQKRWDDWADQVTEAELARVVSYQDMKGESHESKMWQIVLHVVNHATLHRGQAMSMLRQMGVAPPPTDLMYYYREFMVD